MKKSRVTLRAAASAFSAMIMAQAQGMVDLDGFADLTTPYNGVVDYSASLSPYLGTKAFDDGLVTDVNSRWLAHASTMPSAFVCFEFDNEPQVVNAYRVWGLTAYDYAKRSPKNFKLEGSDDGSVWVLLDTQINQTGWTDAQPRAFEFANSVAYRHYRFTIMANNGAGDHTGLSELELFNTQAEFPPVVENLNATDLTVTAATITGGLISTGSAATAVMVYWGASDGAGDPAAWANTNTWPAPQAPGASYSLALSGLAPGTVYYFRFAATNAIGLSFAPESAAFATLPGEPHAVNGAATGVLDTSASLHGTLTYAGLAPTVLRAYWATNDCGTSAAAWLDNGGGVAEAAGTEEGVEAAVTAAGLVPNTMYHYNFMASNAVATAWGTTNTAPFFRTPGPPAIADAGADLVIDTSARLNMTLADGNAAHVFFVWGTDAGLLSVTNDLGIVPMGRHAAELAGLASGTDYYFQAHAVNPYGTASSDVMQLTTLAPIGAWFTVADGLWTNPAIWNVPSPPVAGATAIVDHNVTLEAATPALAAVTVRSGRTLTFGGWETALEAAEIEIAGTVTHLPVTTSAANALGEWAPDHRVWLKGSNITVTATGKIDANGKGYRNWAGPGRAPGKAGGGGHGGEGGMYGESYGGPPYGEPASPWQPGSSGGSGAYSIINCGPGGGAIRIEADGLIRIDGRVSADGQMGSTYPERNGGSGGSIWINCRAAAGNAAGRISAKGGEADRGRGAGGRIALHYHSTAQAAAGVPEFCFDTTPGNAAAGAVTPRMGTLYLSDAQYLTPWTANLFRNTELHIPGLEDWNPASLVLDNCAIGLPAGSALTVAGNLVLTNNAALSVQAAATTNPLYVAGTSVTVGGNLVLGNNSWIYAYADATNGATASFAVGENLLIGTGCGFDADAKGYLRGYGPGRFGGSAGYSIRRGGGGYGGAGGVGESSPGEPAYGYPEMAIQPGGGSIGASLGGNGGGAIRLVVTGDIMLDGTLTACGQAGSYPGGGGGAGGGIHIEGHTVQGGGQIRADGGTRNEFAGAGGGGRISVHYNPLEQSELPVPEIKFSAYAPPGALTMERPEEMGTLYLTDSRFVTETLDAQRLWHVRLVIPEWTDWSPASLTLDNCVVGLPEGFALDVEGDLQLVGSSRLYLWPAPTNAPADRFGIELNVGGSLGIGDSSWMYLYSNPTNGAIARVRVVGNVTVAETGGITADYRGFRSVTGNSNGPGAGKNNSSGGGYGGKGGGSTPGTIYGAPAAYPRHPGSPGGYNGHLAGPGGGAIQLLAGGSVTLDGTISAGGAAGIWAGGPAGSGGAILLVGRKVRGNGAIQALGGKGNYNSGSGGGGRIAVWHRTSLKQFDKLYETRDLSGVTLTGTAPQELSSLQFSVESTASNATGENGTVLFCRPPPQGTLILAR